MDEAVFVAAGAGEIIGDSPERRVEILSDHESLNATVSRFGPRRDGADLHVHRLHTDFFYVLEGELTVRLGPDDTPVTVQPGTLARVPPLVVHGFRNASDADMRFLNFHAPGQQFVEYLRAVRDGRRFSYDQYDPPEDGGRPTSEARIGETLDVVELPGVRIALLAGVEAIGIAEFSATPGGQAPPPHRHPRHVESFYVLEGELTFTIGGRELRTPAGSWVQVPAGEAHTFAFTGDEPVRLLDLHTPSCGLGGFVRGLGEGRIDEAFDYEPA
jgi:quercetin dioxygenase-like cupin family protein